MTVPVAGDVSPALALDVAAGIGFDIARRAIWHEDRCTWFDTTPTVPGTTPPTSVTAGSDVYAGTAGIGLFLAQLAARADDVTLRRTARGALRQALRSAANAPSALGFYGGAAGTGAAAVLAGRELGDDEPVERGRELLRTAALAGADPDANDLIGGTAGVLLALVVAGTALGDERLLERAREAAAVLLALARHGAAGEVSWSTMRDRIADLTGFGHGSAGNAHALLALHAVSPDPALHAAVAGALAYEATTFSAEYGNWPDFRYFGEGPRVAGYTNAWCHGAVGIVRARLFQEAHGFDVAAETDAALRTVATQAEYLRADPAADATLCHGLFGAVDALLDGVRSGRAEYAPLVARCVHDSVERHHVGVQPWPSGLLTHEPIDGLMLGHAGIGHVFLRLADPSLRPVLAPA
jgi:lantibiotic biosynthesis protein